MPARSPVRLVPWSGMAAEEVAKRRLLQWDGASDGWAGSLPLKRHEHGVEIDASALRFAVPTFLLRLRAFVEWHLAQGHSVVVKCPANREVAKYMARMEIDQGLPDGVFEGLPATRTKTRSDVLIPICQLHDADDVEELGEKLKPLMLGHSDDVAIFADAMHMAASELCGNAVEHGRNPIGCYVAAQRYERPHRRTVLALGDLGVGIPQAPRAPMSRRRGGKPRALASDGASVRGRAGGQ